jgi:hypothetical protein
MEEWRVIPKCELYEVSTLGRVRRVGYPEILVLLSQGKYLYFNPSINGIVKNMYVHRAVALAFLPNIFAKPLVDHRNNNKTDNRVVNLRWATHQENALNRRGCSKSGLPKGVSLKKNGRYRAMFREKHLGIYDTPEEAHAAYCAAAEAYSPEFWRD